MRNELNKIFQTVRNNFIWRADQEQEIQYKDGTLKIKDRWDLMEPDENGILRGDCEDFALFCSKLIKEQLGLEVAKRKMTYCITETGEGHMVLEVDGKHVFDNRQRKLTTISKLKRAGYRKFAQPDGPINGVWSFL